MTNVHQIPHGGVAFRSKHQPEKLNEEYNLELTPFQREDDVFQYEFENSAKPIQEQLRLSNKINPEETEHYKIYESVITLLDRCGSICGFRITHKWEPLKVFFFDLCSCFVLLMWVSTYYTHILHYRNGNYIRVLEPIASFGYVISMTLKMVRHYERFPQMYALIFSTRKINKSNLTGNTADILRKCNSQTLIIAKIFLAFVAFCFISFTFPELYMYFVLNLRVNLLPVSFPFFDDTTPIGFVKTNLLQSIIGTFSGVGTAFHGAVFIVIISNYILRVDLIEQDIKDFDEMWTTENISLTNKRKYLINIIKKKQDLTKYMEITNEIYQTRFTVYFGFSYLSLIVCLFEIKKFNYIPGFGMALSLVLEMSFYCSMGTRITIANEKFVDCMYNSRWYQCDLQSQRMIIMLLHNCQQSEEIQLGPIGPLNVVTFISIVKSIYTYYTVLMDLF